MIIMIFSFKETEGSDSVVHSRENGMGAGVFFFLFLKVFFEMSLLLP